MHDPKRQYFLVPTVFPYKLVYILGIVHAFSPMKTRGSDGFGLYRMGFGAMSLWVGGADRNR